MRSSPRRRFPKFALFVGLTLLAVSPLGWAWLQYDLFREEEQVLAELNQPGVDVHAERGAFVAQESGDESEGTLEIMTEQWRDAIDAGFPWLRPLRSVQVARSTSIEQARSVAALPRVKSIHLFPPPVEASRALADAEIGVDLASLPTISVGAADLDAPLPSGTSLEGDELAKLERDLREAWAGRGSERVADRYALTIAGGPAMSVARVSVDGERRKLVHRWPQNVGSNVETHLRVDGDWRAATRYAAPNEGLGLESLPDGPYFYADYDSFPPFVQPEFLTYGEPTLPPSTLLGAGIEHAEKLSDGRYLVRFQSVDTYASNSNGWARSGKEPGHAVEADSVTLILRPDLDWSAERADVVFAGTRRVEWFSKFERRGDVIVVREQVSRSSEQNGGSSKWRAFATIRTAFVWDLDPKFAGDEFTLASVGAGSLGPPREIPLYRRWYWATAAVGGLLTVFASLRIVARRALARQRDKAPSAERPESTTSVPV